MSQWFDSSQVVSSSSGDAGQTRWTGDRRCAYRGRALSRSGLAGALIVLTALQPVHGQCPHPSIEVAPGERLVLQVRGEGDQVYTCSASGTGPRWVLERPDAHLTDASGITVGSHFAGPTWKLNDGSSVQGQLVASQPAGDMGSVPWLLLRAKPGTATGRLAQIEYIRRTDTHGGAAPRSGCDLPADVGREVRVPYTATYSYYAGKPN